MKTTRWVMAGLLAVAARHVLAQGYVEIPEAKSTQTGIGVIAGWHCTAHRIEVRIDDQPPLLAASGTERGDTAGVCGRSNTGFSIIVNWNSLPIHCFGCAYHRVRAYGDGLLFADVTFTVTHYDIEYMTGKSAQYTLRNFPEVGNTTWVQWDEARQNFTISVVDLSSRLFPQYTPTVSGTYHGALFQGPGGGCDLLSSTPRAPRHGSFRVDQSGGAMSFTANYADGGTCRLTGGVREADMQEGFVIFGFDAAAVAQCPEFQGGFRVRADGERLIADTTEKCRPGTAHVVGISGGASILP